MVIVFSRNKNHEMGIHNPAYFLDNICIKTKMDDRNNNHGMGHHNPAKLLDNISIQTQMEDRNNIESLESSRYKPTLDSQNHNKALGFNYKTTLGPQDYLVSQEERW